MDQNLLDYFRISAEALAGLTTTADPRGETGFFHFGTDNMCYGRCKTGAAADVDGAGQYDALKKVYVENASIQLPFDFGEVVTNLRRERYKAGIFNGLQRFAMSKLARNFYYLLRGSLPIPVRRRLQRRYFSDWKKLPFPSWPVDTTVDALHAVYLRVVLFALGGCNKVPFVWFWPDGASNCVIMTHDVETSSGRDFTPQLMDLDDSFGFKASFQVIPEQRYEVPNEYINQIRNRGFEFNLHDINHDGRLYLDHDEFLRRAAKINGYVSKYECQGFRAGSMYRNQDWYDAFEFSYDMSVPNVAHLDPMRGGCCTVMPYFVGNILELPVTTSQDYTLFHMLNDYSIDLWEQQLSLIREKNGLMSFIIHPDYLVERGARKVYASLLEYLRCMVESEHVWAALPGQVDSWWRARNEMRIVRRGTGWDIVGVGSERARLAYASLDGDRVVYEVAKSSDRERVMDR